MDFLRKNKLTGWIVLILILLNVTTLTMLWLGKNKLPGQPDRDRSGDLLEQELGLNESQIQQIKTLRQEHFESTSQLRQQSREARSGLHALWREEGTSTEAAALAKQLGEIQEALELKTFNHFSDVRKVLNEEQKRKFDKIITDVLMRGDGLRGGPPPGGPNGPRGRRGESDRPPPRDGH